MEQTTAERVIERHSRRNFWMNVLDGSAFYLGMSMISRYTVLPLFVQRLSDQAWMQGLIPTLFYVGWLLPGLFMAPAITSWARRKPWIMRATIGERVPFLALGVALLLWPGLPAAALLAIFFALYAVQTFSAGLTSTAWQDFISRVIPHRRWGIFFGLQSGIGGLLGLLGAAAATRILATQPFPQSVGQLALLCFVAMIFSYIFIGLTVEPAQPTAPREPLGRFLRGIGPLLRRDHMFRRYLICRAAIALSLLGHSFLTAAALVRFNLPDADIGGFTAALLAAQAISNLGLGVLADRWGYKQVLELATGLGVLAMVLAVIAPAPAWYLAVFVLVGASQAGYQISGITLVYSFSTPAERPTYLGVANTAIAPIAALGPLLAGALAELAGYPALFVALIVVGAGGLLALHSRVTAPASTPQSVGTE